MSLIHPLHIPEILHVILNCKSILGLDDLASASLVCKSWTQISRRALWRDVELNSESWIDPHYEALFLQLQSHGSFVRNLTLKDCGVDKARFSALLPTMKNLQTVFVDRLMLHSNSSVILRSLELLSFSQLRYLRLPHVSSASGGTDAMLQICDSAYGIQHLELMDSEIDDDVLTSIAKTCPKLKSLDLSRNETVTFGEIIRDHQITHGCDQAGMKNEMDVLASGSGENVMVSKTAAMSTTRDLDLVPIATSVQCESSPYSFYTSTKQHDAANMENSPTLGQQSQQQQRSKQTLQDMHAHLNSSYNDSVLQKSTSYERHIFPKPSLLQMQRPFTHLEELSLVFCLGITNREFQELFWSFRGKSLRSLNLQFTNIEDSGLETLAKALTLSPMATSASRSGPYVGLTSIKVSYCNRITARGIKALVGGCPQLLELEFLCCDQVSAECFREPMPWICTKLLSLEFTFHPRVLFKKGRWRGEEVEASQQTPAMDNTPMQAVDDNQDQAQNTQHISQAQQIQQSEQELREHEDEKESVRDDYYAMFKQLGRLAQLRSLHIYNSPGLSSCANSLDSVVAGMTDESNSVDMVEPSTFSSFASTPVVSLAIQSNTNQTQEVTTDYVGSSSGATRGISNGTSIEMTYRQNPESSHRGSQDMLPNNDEVSTSTSQPGSDSASATVPTLLGSKPLKNLFETMSLHPFSHRMGFKALGRLKALRSLTLYERSSVSLGQSELRWIGRVFPQLLLLQLRGAIEPSDEAVMKLKVKRPKIQVQVSSLFEN
ncbi:hypothetical protein BGX27_005121 [Mortierella sp. AM989]|nr:hypothetical protein BGX27_005121 [Mortierella sp. AM989]